jgi:hypothetical protein
MTVVIDPAVDAEIGDRLRVLLANGFSVENSTYSPEVFGNFVVDLRCGERELRIVRDRGKYILDISNQAELEDTGLWRAFDSSSEFFSALFKYLGYAT